MKANRYDELMAKQMQEYNAFPIGAAYNEKQFAEMMNKWGLQTNNTDKIYHIFSGVFIRKADHKAYHDMIDRFEKELEEAIEADLDGTGFIYDMFYSELTNHEYGYTRDLTNTLDALGYTIDDINADKRLTKGLYNATRQVEKEYEGFV